MNKKEKLMYAKQRLENYNNIEKYISSDNYHYYGSRAIQKYELRKYKEALIDIDKALEANPKYSIGHFYRGKILVKLCRFKEAYLCVKHIGDFGDLLRTEIIHNEFIKDPPYGFEKLLHIREKMSKEKGINNE